MIRAPDQNPAGSYIRGGMESGKMDFLKTRKGDSRTAAERMPDTERGFFFSGFRQKNERRTAEKRQNNTDCGFGNILYGIFYISNHNTADTCNSSWCGTWRMGRN